MPILAFERRERKEKKVPSQRPEESEGKFLIKDWKRAKRKKERKKIPDQRSKENKRNMQKGLRTRQISKQYRIVTTK